MKDYKALVDVIMEADEYHDLQPNWKPKGVDVYSSDEVWKAELWELAVSLSKFQKAWDPERAKISVHVWWQRKQNSSLYSREGQTFLFYLNCQLIEKKVHPH